MSEEGGGEGVTRGRGRGEEGGRVDEAARDASDVWRDPTCFFNKHSIVFDQPGGSYFLGVFSLECSLRVLLTLCHTSF